MRNLLESTAPLDCITKIVAREIILRHAIIAVYQCISPGEFVYLVTTLTKFEVSGHIRLSSPIEHPTGYQQSQVAHWCGLFELI